MKVWHQISQYFKKLFLSNCERIELIIWAKFYYLFDVYALCHYDVVGRQLVPGNNSSCSLHQLSVVSRGKHLKMCAPS